MFCEEHNACDNWTEGLGAAKASKTVRDLIKGRAPCRLQIELVMMGFVEDPARQLALRDYRRRMPDASRAGRGESDGGYCQPKVVCWMRLWQMRCSVIVVGCLVGAESPIATGFLVTADNASQDIDSDYRSNLYPAVLLLFLEPNQSHQSNPFTWTDKDDTFETTKRSSMWNQQTAAADM